MLIRSHVAFCCIAARDKLRCNSAAARQCALNLRLKSVFGGAGFAYMGNILMGRRLRLWQSSTLLCGAEW